MKRRLSVVQETGRRGAERRREILDQNSKGEQAKREFRSRESVVKSQMMHLASLRLRNFRSCVDTTVHFEKDLTVLVGENNGGKTSVLDALRLLTTPSDGRRTRYPEVRDVHRDTPESPIKLDARFEKLSQSQKGWFLTALTVQSEDSALLGYEWTPPETGNRRARPTLTVGPRRSPDPEPATRDLIRHVHLPALRDATRDLASSSPGRIEFLLRHLMGVDGKDKEKALLSRAREAFDGLMRDDPTLQAASSKVAEEFDPLTDGFHPHEARLQFADATLIDLARDLRFRLSQRGVVLADLAETGLGYANLLYLASVLVELAAARDAELTLLLVEEPEAHLHPQLQAVTLDLLLRRARESRERIVEPGQRGGRVQVVVTSHSPNLASSVPCDHIVVLRSEPGATSETNTEPGGGPSEEPEQAERDASSKAAGSVEGVLITRSPATQAVAVSRLGIEPAVLRKVDRYLDVTRSAILFSRRVLLVEGLAEAILMPVFARQLFKDDPAKLNLFHGATIVAIDGVDFEPFVRLLLCTEETGGPTIAERVLVVTDDDAATEEDVEVEDAEEGNPAAKQSAGKRRKAVLESISKEYGVADRLIVLVTNVTFEYALVEHCEEDEVKLRFIESAFSKMVKTSGWIERRRKRFQNEVADKTTPADRAAAFMSAFVERKFRKGDFAQLLAAEIEPAQGGIQPFGVPAPFAAALERLVETT